MGASVVAESVKQSLYLMPTSHITAKGQIQLPHLSNNSPLMHMHQEEQQRRAKPSGCCHSVGDPDGGAVSGLGLVSVTAIGE